MDRDAVWDVVSLGPRNRVLARIGRGYLETGPLGHARTYLTVDVPSDAQRRCGLLATITVGTCYYRYYRATL